MHTTRVVAMFALMLVLSSSPFSSSSQSHHPSLRMLCLGDSYTIGEAVSESERFPNQTVALLTKYGYIFEAPRIIAATGWTTDELQHAINEANIHDTFDAVTLLIGVNNQYRGRDLENYKTEFEALLAQAISFASGKPDRVFVLSIPDWAVTPFAEGRDRAQIAKEIDAFNAANETITRQKHAHYINITGTSREVSHDPDLVAHDGLHPSEKMYALWSDRLAAEIKNVLKR